MGGGFSEIFEGGAAAGGRSVGAGLAVWTAYKMTVFLLNFFAGRYDVRQERLDALDQRLAASLGNRLTHLETAEVVNQKRISILEECLAILASEVRQADPANPKLSQVARMLAGVHPFVPPDPRLEDLLRHAGNALDEEDGA